MQDSASIGRVRGRRTPRAWDLEARSVKKRKKKGGKTGSPGVFHHPELGIEYAAAILLKLAPARIFEHEDLRERKNSFRHNSEKI